MNQIEGAKKLRTITTLTADQVDWSLFASDRQVVFQSIGNIEDVER